MKKTIRIAATITALALLAVGCGDSGVNSGKESSYLNMFLDVFSKNPGHNNDTIPTPTAYTLTVTTSPVEGGTVSRDIVRSSYDAGTPVTVTATPKDGYEFLGWSGAINSQDLSVTVTMDGDKMLLAGFGKRGAKKFTVTFDNSNTVNVTDLPQAISADSGNAILLPAMTNRYSSNIYATVEYEYIFNGWSKEKNNSVADYAANSSYTVTKDVTLYASWQTVSKPYLCSIVNYDGNGKTGGTDPHDPALPPYHMCGGCDSSAKRLIEQYDLVKTGYDFGGWNTEPSGNGTTYQPGPSSYTGCGTLYALWIPTTYSISYTLNTGTVTPANPTSYTIETPTFTLNNPTKTGYTFNGWTGSNGTTPQTTVTIAKGSTGNKNYTANFQPNSYYVTVSSAGTGAIGTGTYAVGTTVTISAGTPPAGMVFNNWTVFSGSGVVFADANSATTTFIMPANAVTVTANWKDVSTPSVGSNNCTSGSTCKSKQIGTQTWMTENLNIVTSDSWCYQNSADSCAKYGRLYTWEAAKTACPNGWHLPSNAEWTTLADYAGGYSTAGSKLKSTSGWYNNGNGTDTYGFSALPGGNRNSDGSFSNAGYYGFWWTATEGGSSLAYGRHMDYGNDFLNEGYYDYDKGDAFSVRCVRDVRQFGE